MPKCISSSSDGAPASIAAERHSVVLVRRLEAPLHLLNELVDAEARWPLTGWILFERGKEGSHHRLGRNEWAGTVRHEKVVESVRRDVRALIGVRPQVEEFRNTQLGERLGPNSQRSRRALLFEHELPVFVTHGDEIAVVVEVDELLARAAWLLTGEIGKLIVAVEMNFPGLAPGLVTFEQLVLDVRIAGCRHEGWHPVEGTDDVVRDRAWLNASGPADHAWHAERAFPVRILLAAERRRTGIRPGILMWTIVGSVDHDGVVADAEIVHCFENRSDHRVVLDHAVGIFGPRGQSRFVAMGFPHMGAEVHPS